MTRSRRRLPLRSIIVAAMAASVWLTPAAQPAPRADAEFLRTGYEKYRAMERASPYRTLSWSYVGPTNISGRSTATAVAERGGHRRIYAGYATSGLWKSDDNGATWQAVFEHMPSTSIGDVAVAASNPDIVWVGTGESNIYRASMPGTGIYKSTDAGRTWRHMGLTDTQTIARVVIHPTNPDVVYVAASGHEWSDNEMRGVFKTTDGGRNWTKILYQSPRTGAIDLVMDPANVNVLYAATWQRVRRKWSDPRVEPGYSESGIFKTTDGGRTWTPLSSGLPEPRFRGRIGLDIAHSNPKVVYALIDNYEEARPAEPNEHDAYGRPITNGRIKAAEIYRSDDGGATWRKTSETSDFMINHSGTYGWVFGQIRVDPKDENTIYSLGINLNLSHDAGRTFTTIRQGHGDNHDLWIDPANTKILYNSNDGGFYQSSNGGDTWTFAQSVNAAEVYNVAIDTASPFHVYGSMQDIGSRRGIVEVDRERGTIVAVPFENAPGGEGSNHAIDPANPDIVYSHGFYGNFTRTDLSQAAARGNGRGLSAVTDIQPKDPPADLRAQWMAPFVISLYDPAVVYAGYQFLFTSGNRGDTWERISPDLTSNDPSRMLPKNSSSIPYQTIVAISESPLKRDLIYAGTDDGRLQTTGDGGKTWTDLTPKLPVQKWISRVVASEHAEGTVYVTQRGREDDDFAPYIYKSTDYGRTFTSIVANIPAGPVNVIREDPSNAAVLYAGTDFGVYITKNGGARWDVLGGNLPSVQVSDLQYHPRDRVLVISTYGRGFWGIRGDLIK
jgi:photosystem II stability/assembly factor-like uncharacterized protein